MEILQTPQGSFTLSRYPKRDDDALRAWDAADEYLLNHIAESRWQLDGKTILIMNDSFGALTTALAPFSPSQISDSYLAQKGTQLNLEINDRTNHCVSLLDSLHFPETSIDIAIIKIPKSHSFLQEQLHRLRPLLHENSQIIAAAMAKQIHTSTLNIFENIIGPTKTSLAKKKARLIFCGYDHDLKPTPNPFPICYPLEGSPYTIHNHSNLFSREKLDIGTRFFLQHIPTGAKNIIDLGCGNGVVGLIAAEKNPDAALTFTDESFMAVDSARINFTQAFKDQRVANFSTTDCLTGIENNSADLILNNPPFHQQHAVGDHIAWKMFKQSKEVLIKGGELRVIGNRHLGYHIKLKKLFGNCSTVSSNDKFVILSTNKR